MDLTNSDTVELTNLRRDLHRFPDVSGDESATASRIVDALMSETPADVICGLGGHGVAAVFAAPVPGPTILFRCELDALPIEERAGPDHVSQHPGKAHLCGHDGHMTILLGLARLLSRKPPARGRIVLLFQPAEETGAGSAAVLADPRFAAISPDYAFALHNRPGLPLGHVGLDEGPVNCASRGMKIVLRGKEAHAASPETGISPMFALSELMPALARLGRGQLADSDFRLVTVTHARMGAPAFGISPGTAEIFATLRTRTDAGMDGLCAAAEALIGAVAKSEKLTLGISYHDIFAHCENDPEAVDVIRKALMSLNIPYDTAGCPMSASEDFGRFGRVAKSAMFFLGAGQAHAELHNPDYDFPDSLIPIAARVFYRMQQVLLG